MRHNLFLAFGLAIAGASASFPQALVPLNAIPSRIVGHPQAELLSVISSAPNLVEGRELWGPNGIALDTSVTPNILYVSDTFNNRVLAWKNATGFTSGQPADLVIGQQDMYRTSAQGPGQQFQTGLNSPTGLAVDSNGNLYVADSGNNRILRFPKPFANAGLAVSRSLYRPAEPEFPHGKLHGRGSGAGSRPDVRELGVPGQHRFRQRGEPLGVRPWQSPRAAV